jgi:ABC-type glycerol-3-phosphate transport system permease component
MKFKVSEKFKSKGRRNTILTSILVIALIVGLVWMFISSTTTTNKITSAVGVFLLLKYLPHAYRNIKNHDSSYLELEILEHENKLNISHKAQLLVCPYPTLRI